MKTTKEKIIDWFKDCNPKNEPTSFTVLSKKLLIRADNLQHCTANHFDIFEDCYNVGPRKGRGIRLRT